MPRASAPSVGPLVRVALALGLAWPAIAAADASGPTEAASYLQPLPAPIVSKASSASRWAGLGGAQCLTEVARRKLGVTRWRGGAVGVASPVRVTGPIGGVRFVTPGRKSPYGILDCRLALALADLAEILKRHDVVEVRVDNMYAPRPPAGQEEADQHAYGLAMT